MNSWFSMEYLGSGGEEELQRESEAAVTKDAAFVTGRMRFLLML